PMAGGVPTLGYSDDSGRVAYHAVAVRSGSDLAAGRDQTSQGRAEQSRAMVDIGKEIPGADVNRYRVRGDRFYSSHSIVHDRARNRPAGSAPVHAHFERRRYEEAKFPAIIFRRRCSRYGKSAHGLQWLAGADQRRVLVAGADVDAPDSVHSWTLLD